MSLQCQTGNTDEDRNWQRRCELLHRHLLATLNTWCQNDEEFPVSPTIAAVLQIFSPIRDPFREVTPDIAAVGEPVDEGLRGRPQWEDAEIQNLISALDEILTTAAGRWTQASIHDPPVEAVERQLRAAILGTNYFTFRRPGAKFRPGFFGAG